MLPTFRTMVIAVAAVFLALMVTARGLVTAPEAVTRIGEVPPLGRTLVQLAQVPLDDTQKRFVAEAVARAERAEIEAEARIQQADAAGRSVTADGAAAPRAPETASEMASEIAADSRPAGGPSLPLVAADERRRPPRRRTQRRPDQFLHAPSFRPPHVHRGGIRAGARPARAGARRPAGACGRGGPA